MQTPMRNFTASSGTSKRDLFLVLNDPEIEKTPFADLKQLKELELKLEELKSKEEEPIALSRETIEKLLHGY